MLPVLVADSRYGEQMEKLGREMIGKCTGLPLAIIVLGGLLVNKSNLQWDIVSWNITAYLSRGRGREQLFGVTEVLALSYHELPYYLKPCHITWFIFQKITKYQLKN